LAANPRLLSNQKLNLERVSTLLVDDNPQSLDILTQVVNGFGVRNLSRVLSGEEARDHLKRQQVDLLITDAQMPGMDGYDLITWLRREGGEPNRFIPVIIVTGHTRQSDVLKGRDCGANYIITKPISPKILLERIFWVAKSERLFIEAPTYVGPDRRFKRLGPPPGMDGRRSDDLDADLGAATTPNMSQDEIDALMKPSKVAL
jgi:CheY-like chemotaxis protein